MLWLFLYLDPLIYEGREGGMIEVSSPSYIDSLEVYGITVRSRFGNIATVFFNHANLEKLGSKPWVLRIEASKNLRECNERAIEGCGIRDLHNIGYTGGNVLVGVFGRGIDPTHPDVKLFLLWDQENPYGNPPSGFSYGSFYEEEEIIFLPSLEKDGHGTAVCASVLSAVPDGKVIFVKGPMDEASVLDGLRWMGNVADSLGLPLSINLSYVHSFGPHDGKTLFERAIDHFLSEKEGRVLAVPAGNEGGERKHASGTIEPGDSSSCVLDSTSFLLFTASGDVYMVAYYPSDAVEYVNAGVYGGAGTGWIPPGEKKVLKDGDFPFDSLAVFHSDYGNGWNEVWVGIYGGEGDKFYLRFYGDVGIKVHAWIEGNGYFVENLYGWKRFIPPVNAYLVGPPGGCEYAITCGAVTSRISWTDWEGEVHYVSGYEGEIPFWSSPGPLTSGRIKPDIVAPGKMIITALSGDAPSSYITDPYHRVYWGTSFSSAFITGGVALLLSKEPSLSAGEVVEILHGFGTGDGDSISGWGEVNFREVANVLTINLFLSYFTGRVEDGRVKLIWETSSEIGVKEFVLERDGIEIGRLEAAGYSSKPVTYTFSDIPSIGEHEYSLHVITTSEKKKIASTRVVFHPEGRGFEVLPAISSGSFLIRVFDVPTEIGVYSCDGRKVETIEVGEKEIHWTPSLPSGVYFLKLNGISRKIIIL
ncbi:hypothetical protein DRQ20_02545 [bacterium]|nr:MAG: hypothetical protein DRQ20_02545 [bacterium]